MGKKGKDKARTEANFTLLPAKQNERSYGFIDQVAVQVCFGIAAWYFLAGAQTGYYVPLSEAIPSILVGNCVPLFLIAFAGFYSARFGVDSLTASQGAFGAKGPVVIIVMFVTQLAVSASMPMLLFGQLAIKFSARLGFPEFLCTETPGVAIWSLMALAIGIYIAYSGPDTMMWFSRISAVLMVGIIVWLCYYIIGEYGFDYIANAEPRGRIIIEGNEGLTKRWNNAAALETNFGLGFSWAFMFGMFTRMGKSEGQAYHGCIWGWGIISCCAIMFGAVVALATGAYDPSDWILEASEKSGMFALAIMGLIFMAVANISSIAINTYPGAIAITSRWPKVKWGLAIALVGIPTIILLNPEVYYRISNIYAIVGLLTSVFAGIMTTETLFVSKGRVSIREFYDRKNGFKYYKGINPAGFIAMACGLVVYLLILNPLTYTSLTGLFPYTCAALPTYFITGIVYLILMKCWILKKYPVTFLNNIEEKAE